MHTIGVLAADDPSWFTSWVRSLALDVIQLLAQSMTWWTEADRTSMLQSPGIGKIQDQLRYVGLVVLTGSMIWQGIKLTWTRKADPLVSTGVGLLSFLGWSTMGTTLAVMLNEAGIALASTVLNNAINDFVESISTALQVLVLSDAWVIFLLSIVLFFLAGIQWVLGFFRQGALVILLGLLPTAAAGQVNEATKPWLRTVLTWCLSLILYQPIGAIVFAIGYMLMGSNGDLPTLLTGVAVLVMGVLSMPTMLRFFQWGGQKFVSGGSGGGGAQAAGAAASMLGGAGGAAGFGRYMDQTGTAGGGGRQLNGAQSVVSAHNGDGPAGADTPASRPGGGEGTPRPGNEVGSAANPGGGTDTPDSGGALTPGEGASAGAPAGTGSGAGSSSSPATASAGTTSTGAASGASASGAAAGASGVGAAAVAGKEAVDRASGAVTDAMTDGNPGGEG
jgi:hypothetical protein